MKFSSNTDIIQRGLFRTTWLYYATKNLFDDFGLVSFNHLVWPNITDNNKRNKVQ